MGDITYHWTDEGWLYTATVKDLCTKNIVGYAMGDRIDKSLVIYRLTTNNDITFAVFFSRIRTAKTANNLCYLRLFVCADMAEKDRKGNVIIGG